MSTELRNAAEPDILHDGLIHYLRHSFASFGVSFGLSLRIIGALLGHTQPQTTARYAHLDDEALRRATNSFAKVVEVEAERGEAELASLPGGR